MGKFLVGGGMAWAISYVLLFMWSGGSAVWPVIFGLTLSARFVIAAIIGTVIGLWLS